MQVERGRRPAHLGGLGGRPSGGRVSNAWATYPIQGDTTWKQVLIPHVRGRPHGRARKAVAVWDGPASDQLVGGVKAHQGDDR